RRADRRHQSSNCSWRGVGRLPGVLSGMFSFLKNPFLKNERARPNPRAPKVVSVFKPLPTSPHRELCPIKFAPVGEKRAGNDCTGVCVMDNIPAPPLVLHRRNHNFSNVSAKLEVDATHKAGSDVTGVAITLFIENKRYDMGQQK